MRYLTLLFCFLLGIGVRAQIGQNPPEVDWKKIDTDVGRVIFPEGFEARARRVATLIELLEAKHGRSIGEQHYDFDLILRTYDMTANGYVGLAPFRSEFFATAPQSLGLLGNADWLDLLTIHEYRHVQQNSNERRGITKLFSYLQGENGWGVLSGIATPNWFSEGDAVTMETALTAGGRGRTPRFSQTLRSMLAGDVVYSYAKARNGSLRSLVPDHYRYGYSMVTYARERFGNDFWRSVVQDGAAYKSLLYPFSSALKKKAGMNTRQLYVRTMENLATMQDSALTARGELVAGTPVGADFKTPTNYRFPFVDGEGRLLALRSGFKHTPALVVVDPAGGKDRLITTVGIQREPYVDVRGNLATWMETRQDPRYSNKNFSDIIVYELNSGRKRRLTERGKLLVPSLSFDRQRIVAVEDEPIAGPPALVIFDTQSGAEVQRFALEAVSVSYPRFGPAGNTLYFYDRDFTGVAIQALKLADGSVRTVKKRSAEPIDWLQVTEAGTLVYASGRDGVDNIYELDPENGTVRQLTNVPIGAILPHLTAAGELFYTSATPRGLRLRRLAPEQKSASLAGEVRPVGRSFFERPAAFREETVNLSATVEERDYLVADFADNFGGIKLHSWSFNGSYVSPGLVAEATNALRTVALTAEGRYNVNEKRYSGGLAATYAGWYPQVTLRGEFRDRNYGTLNPARDTFIFNGQEFNQLSLGANVAVPLRWVAGEYRTLLQPQVGLTYFALGDAEEGTLPKSFTNLGLGLFFSTQRRRALQQVQSRLGATLQVNYDAALGDQLGQRFMIRSALLLPGAFPTHGLRLELDYQRQPAGNLYQYTNIFRYARGYVAPVNDQVVRLGVNYQLPLLYPDFGIAGIVYFQRIRLNAFYDYSRYQIDQFRNFAFTENAVGGEVFFDNVWLNVQDLT
ncbi:MAG: hypothetical protein AAFZ52_14250, partial [Bacteroidota bacterium]